MRRNDGCGFLRFPLYPGSLLLMEGAVQEDWQHQVSFFRFDVREIGRQCQCFWLELEGTHSLKFSVYCK